LNTMLRLLSHFTAVVLTAAWAASVGSTLAYAQARPKVTSSGVEKPASMIWAGNSFFYFNNSLHSHVGALLTSADPSYRLRQTSVTISGSGIDWHDMESYFRPNAIGNYSFDPQNNVVFNKLDRLFDLAIMMDCSQCPIHPSLSKIFIEYAKKNADIARKHGAKPVFFMSWAYGDKPAMTQELADAYLKVANENDALVIPAGLAFARSIAKRPELNLYQADKRHPSLAGSYLAAATVYAAIFKTSPVGLKYDAGLGAETAAHLQAIAQETVAAFYN
jgi:hypothetical protein